MTLENKLKRVEATLDGKIWRSTKKYENPAPYNEWPEKEFPQCPKCGLLGVALITNHVLQPPWHGYWSKHKGYGYQWIESCTGE